jgi:hypothetical protein
MYKLSSLLVLAALALFSLKVNAQSDSLILKNNNVIVGEVKSMDRGVVTIETPYSKDDFRVEWSGINKISTTTFYIITLEDGTRMNGKLEGADSGKVSIKTPEGVFQTYKKEEVVHLQTLKSGFWDRAHAKIDFGFSNTKSKHLKNISLRSNVGYIAEKWSADASFNSLFSSQDEVDPIKSSDGGVTFNYLLPKDWYIPVSLTFLSNTEQKIDLRTIGKLGVGNYIIHTNHSYWGLAGGVSYNKEDYSEAVDRKSWEGYFGTELNLYDIGDLNLLTKLVAYPSFTESGRWRADFNFDAKYSLPLDLYIKFGISMNYDNSPVEGAPTSDYMLQTGLGWEL